MKTPTEFLATLWKLLGFLPLFALLLLLGVIKAIIFGPVALLIITVGSFAVIVGLWPVHLSWTYYCIAKTKKLGLMLKVVVFLTLPVPLILWPVLGIIGSIVAGIGYGIFAPLMATFEAVGEGKKDKFKKCFMSGTWSTILRSCTIVRDFMDVCYHSYFSILKDIRDGPPKNDTPLDIKWSQLPGCILVGLLGVIVDVPIITVVAIYKAPVMLFKGWKRLLQDLIGREGPFLETACVPFAGLSIVLWPLVVIFAALGAILSSFFLGIYGAAVVYQEASIERGLAYIVAAISLFDENSNDMLGMQEGSCFPRPKYRDLVSRDHVSPQPAPDIPVVKPGLQRPLSFRNAWQQLKSVQVWDSLFHACELYGKGLMQVGAIRVSDLQEWKHSESIILNVGLPAYVLLQCFLRSVKSGSTGFIMRDGKELTRANRPEGRVFEWFFEPMSTMKDQIRSQDLVESEELYLLKLVLTLGDPQRMEAWDNGGIPPRDDKRRAELEALSRRLQGFCRTLSRMPTFRRRFQDVVRKLHHVPHDIENNSVELESYDIDYANNSANIYNGNVTQQTVCHN